jgi:hypothetical protein
MNADKKHAAGARLSNCGAVNHGCSRLFRRLDQLESWSAGRIARPTLENGG